MVVVGQRCPWLDLSKPDYVAYHDEEWGVPVHDDAKHFEFLTLESAQAGLSWYTVLRKRENYRRLFAGFDPAEVARFSEKRVEAMLGDVGIIRNRAKVEAAVNNAGRFLEVQEAFGSFDAYLWGFVDGETVVNSPRTMDDYVATSAVSDALSADLKARGFRWVGPTTVYAYLQAAGLVNDHAVGCFRRQQV